MEAKTELLYLKQSELFSSCWEWDCSPPLDLAMQIYSFCMISPKLWFVGINRDILELRVSGSKDQNLQLCTLISKAHKSKVSSLAVLAAEVDGFDGWIKFFSLESLCLFHQVELPNTWVVAGNPRS